MSAKVENRKNNFIKRLNEKWPSVKLIGEYVNRNTFTQFYCEEHDCYFETTPTFLMARKSCCPQKAKEVKSINSHNVRNKSFEYYSKVVYEKFGENIIILNTPEKFNTFTEIEFYCKKHNHKWKNTLFNVINSDYPCELCRKEEKKKNDIKKGREDFIKRFYSREEYKNYKIVDIEQYTSYNSKMDFICDKGHKFSRRADEILIKDKMCPYCFPYRKAIISWKERYPDKVKYIKNIESVPNIIGDTRVEIVCPNCGKSRIVRLNGFLRRKEFFCPFCDKDGISYPNKILRELFAQLKTDKTILEYRINFSNKHWFIYDCYFEINETKYCVEMDGRQHKTGYYREKDLLDKRKINIKERDKEKEEYLKTQNIILIRIDCSQSRIDYIKDKILNSELSKIFDLNSINWEEIDKISQKNWVKEVCEDYKENGYSIEELIKKYKLAKITIMKFLRKGTKWGWCNYNGKKIVLEQRGIANYELYKEDLLLGTFYSAKEIHDFIAGLGITTTNIQTINKMLRQPDYCCQIFIDNNLRLKRNMVDTNIANVESNNKQ